MLNTVCTRYFLTAGKGTAKTELGAFDRALMDAGVADVNHLKLSSSLPPGCTRVPARPLESGGFSATAFARKGISKGEDTNGHIYMSSAVAIGIPKDPTLAGLIMETSGLFNDVYECEEEARRMVVEGMAYRLRDIKDIQTAHVSLDLTELSEYFPCGATFAAVVLLP